VPALLRPAAGEEEIEEFVRVLNEGMPAAN